MTTPTAAAAAGRLFRSTPSVVVEPPSPEVVLISRYRLDDDLGLGSDDVGGVNATSFGTWNAVNLPSLVAGTGGTSIYKAGGSTRIVLPADNPLHALTEVSLSFYYQPSANTDKHILFTVATTGGSTAPGDLSVERLTNGRLRAWHVGQDGGLRYFESTDGIASTNLLVGTAYQITMTLGPSGAKLYLRQAGSSGPALVAEIPQNTNGWNNTREKFLGVWINTTSAPAEGVFDHLRIWSGNLSASGVAALGAPVSISLAAVSDWANSETLNGTAAAATLHNFTVTVPNGTDRAALVAIGTDVAEVSTVVLDPVGLNVPLTKVRQNSTPSSHISLWRLLEAQMPVAGIYTLRVTLTSSATVEGHWQSAINTQQQVFATGCWERNKTSLVLRADRIYASGALAYAAMLEGSRLSGWTVSQLFKKLELQNGVGGDTFVVARGRLTTAGAPEPTFSNAASADRLVGIQAFLLPVGAAAPVLRTINRPDASNWTDHGTQISRAAGTWEDGIATTSGCNGLAVLEWLNDKLYCLYLGYDGDRPDGGAKHRAMGIASSPDGVTWTKHSGNPVVTHHRTSGTNHEEEGIGGFAAAINPNDNKLYTAWGALEAVGAAAVRSDLSLSVAANLDEETPTGIPANALDRSGFSSTLLWIQAMNAQGRPGKVGSGVWDVPARTPLTRSIYGYGTTKPIFRGPKASFLYVQAPDVLVTGVRFEDISMPFISSDDTVDDDWGDNLIPSQGYSWNYGEYSLLQHNADLRNLRIENCDFVRCGVCVMLVRHFRVHDGLTFSNNFVRDGMGCVTILGYRFQNIVLNNNDIRDMVGSRFSTGSANHTETLFMIGGINNPLRGDFMALNSVTALNNTCINFTSSHPQNNKNAAVFLDIRQGGNILCEDNYVENFYNTAGSNDANAVYLKSRGNIRFRRNTWINCGARPSSTAFGSEGQIYGFKGGSEDIISEDDVFIGGPQSGNAPWITIGTASGVIIRRPTFNGWRNDGVWGGTKGRPGVPCLIHHWSGSSARLEDITNVTNCGWSGPKGYLIAHRDKSAGACPHNNWQVNFQNNQRALVYKGSGTAAITLTNCRTADGQSVTIDTGTA